MFYILYLLPNGLCVDDNYGLFYDYSNAMKRKDFWSKKTYVIKAIISSL